MSFPSYAPKTFRGGGGGGDTASPDRVRVELCLALFRSISMHKMVLNFSGNVIWVWLFQKTVLGSSRVSGRGMPSGPFGRASVHVNNGQDISSYVLGTILPQ